MITFEEIVETVEHLNEDKRDELWTILKKKKEEEILKASEEAKREYKEGKTVSLKSPEETKKLFNNLGME